MDILLLQADGAGGGFGFLVFPALIFLVMYVFLILPGQRKQKKLQESLSSGQEVILSSGIYGRIVKLDDATATILVDEKTKIKVTRNAISQVVPKG